MFDWVSDLGQDIMQGDYLFVVALLLLVGYACWRVALNVTTVVPPRWAKRFSGLCAQIGFILMLERLYEFSRAHIAVDQLTALAYHNGYQVANFEIAHGIFIEQRLQALFLGDRLLMGAIYGFYGFAHLFVTLGLLIWVYLRRNYAFGFVRNMFYVTTGIALISYVTFPATPPRLFSNLGFVDPSQQLGFTPAGGAQVTNYTYNPYAAMPSLHLVYALIVGATLIIVGRHLWLRLFGAVYPVLMLAVILISGNHWILDALGAVVVVAAGATILGLSGALIRGFAALYDSVFRAQRAATGSWFFG